VSGLQQVHLRVNDAATGQPTPVRIRVTDGDGKYHAPFGRLTHFSSGPNQEVGGNLLLGGKPWAYIDGACEVNLPPGPIHVDIAKGPEYTPVSTDLQLTPGKLALRLQIERWSDVCRQGWHSGDTRVHFLPPHAALLEAQAEDVAFVQLLARQTQTTDSFGQPQPAIPNLLAFSGQAPCLQAPGHAVVVNTENWHPQLGSLGLLHCHRVVHPLTFGGPDGVDDWSLADWCGQCHRKHGLVVWTRTLHESEDFDHGEPLVNLIVGEVDAFEFDHFEDSPFDALSLWYDLLRLGLRAPLAGASSKDGNGIALGTMRTYAHIVGEASCKEWIEALRAGRSFVSNGPLLNFTVDGQLPGAVVSAQSGCVRVQAQAQSLVPFDVLEVVQNGLVIAKASASGSPASASIEIEAPIVESSWLTLRCTGQAQVYHRPANQRIFAHTSPVYVDVPGKPLRADPAVAQRFAKEIERMIAWCQTKARCPTPQSRERLTAGFVKGLERLRQMCQ
jgi:hypothetical protein